jgi:Tfp pilus assembly protein PilF
MLDTIIELIPMLRNSLLNDREKRLIVVVILISLPLTLFLVSFTFAFTFMQPDIQENEEKVVVEQKIVNPVANLIPQRTIKYTKTEREALYLLLSKAFNEGNYTYAEEISERLMANDADDNFAKYILAKMKIENEKFSEANEILINLRAKNYMPDSLKTLFISVVSFNELPRIIADTASLTATQLAKVGERYLAAKNKSAQIFFTKALEKDSTNIEALYQLARWYMSNKDYKKAEKLLNKLLSIDSTSPRIIGRYAMLLHETGREKQALVYYKKAIEKNPYDFNLAFNLGELYFSSLNDNANARIFFQRAKELSPDIWQSYFKIGLIFMEESKLDSAINYFRTANGYSANNPRILQMLAAAYEKNGDIANALRVYERILARNPLDDIALYKTRLLRQK